MAQATETTATATATREAGPSAPSGGAGDAIVGDASREEARTYDVILLPTQAQVLEFRKRAARGGVAFVAGNIAPGIDGAASAVACSAAARESACDADARGVACDGSAAGMASCRPVRRADPLFGVTVSTFEAWVADLWGRYGDGRFLVSSTERLLAMRAAFERTGRREEASGGMMALTARCAREGAGLREFDGALAAVRNGRAHELPDALQPAELTLLETLAVYFDLLEGLDRVELGSALALLAGALPPGRCWRVLAEGFPPSTLQQRRFFDACPQLDLTWHEALGARGVGKPPAPVEVRFAFPSGRYARPRLLADVACSFKKEGCARMAFVCADAVGAYEDLAPLLEHEGIACALAARAKFSETDFGRVLFALHRLACDEAAAREDLVDALYAPLLGLSSAQVRRVDARLRSDRLADARDEYAALRADSAAFSYLEDLASDPQAVVVAGALEDAIRALPGVSEAYRREQLGALNAAREACGAACRLGLGADACMAALEEATVDVSRRGPAVSQAAHEACRDGGGDAFPTALFCSRNHAAALPPRSQDALVLCDMTSEGWPVAEREDAGAALLAKLGILPTDDAPSRARRTFAALEGVSARKLYVERCLFDAAAEPTYPAMVVEELVDCYRADPSATDDLDNPYLLPPVLREGLVERGEEHLAENLSQRRTPIPVAARIERPALGAIRPERRALVVLPRGGREGGEICLSASQMESYLACPYQWFAQRRLRLQSLDEEFGPLQMGDFAHHALEGFYRAFQERTGTAKVSPQTLGVAREVMRDVLDAHQALQASLAPDDNRLVPTSELEAREVEELKTRLVRYLDFEAQLLPGFRPAYLEYEVGVRERVEYAGVRLVGKIDRIDVDDAGHAVVIDYKGSLTADYELLGDEEKTDPAVPAKVQALIYAQVVRRLLGLDVVGALYVCYGREPRLAGAYDARVLETPHLPHMRHDRCACAPEGEGSFANLLDATECRCAQAAQALLSGEVEPAPATPAACAYCPVSSCAQREDR